jgi:FkbM family methyltransferase
VRNPGESLAVGAAPALSPRARVTWLAHLFKACVKQHHRELVPALAPLIPKDAIVVDIGGHAGQFCKLFARMAPRGHVYSIEPGGYALSILRPAVRFNRLANVTIIPAAVGEAPGTATLRVPVKVSGSIGFGLGHLAGTGAGGERPTLAQSVEVTTLDRIVADHGIARLHFIKADIEGWELRMLRGAVRTLERLRPTLMVEVNRAALARAEDTPEDIHAMLDRLGYSGLALTPDLRFAAARRDIDSDVFFVPEERAAALSRD